MKIFACLSIDSASRATLPTVNPLTIPTGGWKVDEGKYLVQGEMANIAGELTLLILSASPMPALPSFCQCAGMADDEGRIQGTGLMSSLRGPFVGTLAAIEDGTAYFVGGHCAGERVEPSVAAAPVAIKPLAACKPSIEPVRAPEPVIVPEVVSAPEPVIVPEVVATPEVLIPVAAPAPAVVVVPEVVIQPAEAREPDRPRKLEILTRAKPEGFPVNRTPIAGLTAISSSPAPAPERPAFAAKKSAASKPAPKSEPVFVGDVRLPEIPSTGRTSYIAESDVETF